MAIGTVNSCWFSIFFSVSLILQTCMHFNTFDFDCKNMWLHTVTFKHVSNERTEGWSFGPRSAPQNVSSDRRNHLTTMAIGMWHPGCKGIGYPGGAVISLLDLAETGVQCNQVPYLMKLWNLIKHAGFALWRRCCATEERHMQGRKPKACPFFGELTLLSSVICCVVSST